MKSLNSIKINGKNYTGRENFPWYFIYPFFLVHMLAFGLSSFFMAYSNDGPPVAFLYMHGGFAIFVYTIFYLTIFGPGQVKWMFINAGLGLLGIYAQIDWILSLFGKKASDYPPYVHVIPFLYYILYTFLLYQMVLDLTGARDSPQRRRLVENCYITLSVLIYGTIYLWNH